MEHVLTGLHSFIPIMRTKLEASHVECKSYYIPLEMFIDVSAYGSFLSRLGKHVAEWTNLDFDPENALVITAVILQVEKVDQQSIVSSDQIPCFPPLSYTPPCGTASGQAGSVRRAESNIGGRVCIIRG